METMSRVIAFPLLQDPSSYTPCTINYEKEGVSKVWLDVFRRSIPSFKARAASDSSVKDADVKATKFALRFGEILDDLEKDPESHGGPPDCVLLVRLREQVLREVGFEDIFKKVKADENEAALALLPELLKEIDGTEDKGARYEMVTKGVFAGNIFDLGAGKAEQEAGTLDFKKSFADLLPRPWAVDNFDELKAAWLADPPRWSKAVVFVDNSGADIILGVIPFARELIRNGTRVVLAANDLPSINDITYEELSDIVHKIDDELLQAALDNGSLLVVNSGSDLPVLDLTSVSPELAWVAEDADLVVFEGMGRGIETNLNAKLKVDSVNLGMIKHKEVAEYLKGRMYDCVCKYNRVAKPEGEAGSTTEPLPSPKQHVLSGYE